MVAPSTNAPAVGKEAEAGLLDDPREHERSMLLEEEDPPPPGETGQELTGERAKQAVEDALRDTIPAASEPQAYQLEVAGRHIVPQLFRPLPTTGDTLLVNLGEGVLRPLMVTTAEDGIVSGVVFCDPGDHTLPAFRGHTAFSGRPDRFTPFGLAEGITEGQNLGQWRHRAWTGPTFTITPDNSTTKEA